MNVPEWWFDRPEVSRDEMVARWHNWARYAAEQGWDPRIEPPKIKRECVVCGAEADCYGVYEDPEGDIEYSCDIHCGHGNEDGWCERVYGR